MMAINRFLQQQQATLQSIGLSEVLERVLAIINRMYRIYTIFLSLLTYLGTRKMGANNESKCSKKLGWSDDIPETRNFRRMAFNREVETQYSFNFDLE